MFNKPDEDNVFLNIDTKKIPDHTLRNLIINLLGFIGIVVAIVLAVVNIVTTTIAFVIGIFGWCFMQFG